MDKTFFELMARYNKNANEKMNEIIVPLSDEEWNRQFPGYFKSVHELCSHIFGGDHRWLRRFKATGNFKSLENKRFDVDYDFNHLFFSSVSEYVTERVIMDAIIIDFVNELPEDGMDKKVNWINTRGIACTCRVKTGLVHLSHHETHHRGMISLLLEFLGKENDYSSLFLYE